MGLAFVAGTRTLESDKWNDQLPQFPWNNFSAPANGKNFISNKISVSRMNFTVNKELVDDAQVRASAEMDIFCYSFVPRRYFHRKRWNFI